MEARCNRRLDLGYRHLNEDMTAMDKMMQRRWSGVPGDTR
jgi:hypothetical protein